MTVDFDPAKFGEAMGAMVREAIAPLLRRVDELEHRQPEKGERGEQGPAGKDAAPVDTDAVIDSVLRALLDSPRLETLADLKAAEAVAKHFEAHPVRDGRDGERGPQGERGVEGPAGKDGRDGLDVRDMLRNSDNHLIAVMSDGTTRDLGLFVGRDGADGLSMADVSRTYDAEAHEVVERWTAGGEAKELRYPAGGIRPGGFWREGMKSLALQAVTHDGALWIAKRDNASKPCLENSDDWQLAARKGRDGRDFTPPKPTGPVALGSPDA